MLEGIVRQSRPDGLVHIACGPVTMELSMPPAQAAQLSPGNPAELHTYLHFSAAGDQLRLFGFNSADARDLFTRLISGSGVGPRVALGLIDLGLVRLVTAIRDGDEAALTRVSGVGPKLAKKILAELSDRIAKEFGALAQAEEGSHQSAALRGVLDAVVGLGYSRTEAEAAYASIRAEPGTNDPSTAIRLILRQLSSR